MENRDWIDMGLMLSVRQTWVQSLRERGAGEGDGERENVTLNSQLIFDKGAKMVQ